MKIYAYNTENKVCTIDIPNVLKEAYICTFGITSPAKNQVEKWLEKKGYEMKCRENENNFISLQIGS